MSMYVCVSLYDPCVHIDRFTLQPSEEIAACFLLWLDVESGCLIS